MGTRRHFNICLFLTVFFLSLIPKANGRIIYVDTGANGKNNGSTWSDAYMYLQDALAAASGGDEIWVAEGVYKPDRGAGITLGDRTATFRLKNGVALYGGLASGQTRLEQRVLKANLTILSGDLNGDDGADFANNGENSYQVVTSIECDETALMDGFKITGGNSDEHRTEDHNEGGGMYNEFSCPTLVNCTFCDNFSTRGGGMCNQAGSNPKLINCTFRGNSAHLGGGMCNFVECSPVITNCTFYDNRASNKGGAIHNQGFSSPILTNCKIIGNTAGVLNVSYGFGGGLYNRDGCNPVLINCIITGNSAKGNNVDGYGGGICNRNFKLTSMLTMTNCTFAGNSAPKGNALAFYSHEQDFPTSVRLTNCILWDDDNYVWTSDNSEISITYSDVKGGLLGVGNINVEPMFVDADGPDNVFGTEDDDLRLSNGSQCIDAGNNFVVPLSILADLGGRTRIINGIVDMGAYEFRGMFNLYVDIINGDNNNDGLTLETAFATIQKAIDVSENGDTVFVYPGTYQEEIKFLGKAITVQGIATEEGVPVLQNPGDFAASFYYSEGLDSVLKNFVIEKSFMGIFIAGSSPTISNVTVVENKYGIEAYAGSEPDISNSILWNNTVSDLFQCRAQFSCIERASAGQGNIDTDPLFVDSVNGDYHLSSRRGRYWPEHDVWILDKVTSPCIDGGDPTVDPFDEPMPNGHIINMGAYGGTAYASMSESPVTGEVLPPEVVEQVHGITGGFHYDSTWFIAKFYNGSDYTITQVTIKIKLSGGITRDQQWYVVVLGPPGAIIPPGETAILSGDVGVARGDRDFYWEVVEIVGYKN